MKKIIRHTFYNLTTKCYEHLTQEYRKPAKNKRHCQAYADRLGKQEASKRKDFVYQHLYSHYLN